MENVIPKSYFAGLGVYTACIALAAAPIFPLPLGLHAVIQLAAVAAIASLIVLTVLSTGLHAKMGDEAAAFIQAAFGIGICVGLYTYVSGVIRPHVLDMALLWIIVGLSHLTPRRVLVLSGIYLGLYGLSTYYALWDAANPQHADSLYVLLVSCILVIYLYWRSSEYEALNSEKHRQAAQLEAAAEHIQNFTVQDTDTTALKQAYFMGQLAREKARVDQHGGTFSAGLIDIDGYAELHYKLGETVAKQVLREFAERASNIIRNMDTLSVWSEEYRPLGRIAGGRFGLILPGADFADAMKCAERLHASLEFQAMRTTAGVIGVTLSIGVTEYAGKESTQEVMNQAAKALDMARSHNGNDYKGLRRAA